MIPRTDVIWQSENWQQELAHGVRELSELAALLELDLEQLPATLTAQQQFPLRVPRGFVARMEKGNPNDPLLLQVLPRAVEMTPQPGFTSDPLAEQQHNPAAGIIHKYPGRVLLVVSGGCAINCRYCFRRHFPYGDNNPGKRQWQQSLQYIADDPSITEVIFSGGDPLAASDEHLAWLVDQLSQIPHVQRLRVHSRMPIVLPSRITEPLLDWLAGSRLQPVMVVHCNHANEIDAAVHGALGRLRDAGVTLLNQAVLLKRINDDGHTLCRLSEQLFRSGVLPYYLHLLDKVSGAAHYEVPAPRAVALVQQVRHTLPGYLVPKLVKEEAGRHSKTPLAC